MHKKKIGFFILIVLIILSIATLINRDYIVDKINSSIKKEDLPKFEYQYYEKTDDGKYVTLVTFRDTTGINSISYTDENNKETIIDCKGKLEVGLDFEANNFEHYYFTTVSSAGQKTINDMYLEIKNSDYQYTGGIQEYTVSASGYYKIEAWGASGGYGYGNVNPYGLGAYVSGNVYLEKGQVLYLYLGQKGYNQTATTSFNGGGAGFYGDIAHKGGQGGGATDVRLVNGEWNSTSGLQKRILVAGGGGGGQSTCGGTNTTAGNGGTLNGVNSLNLGGSYYGHIAYGGTQTVGGGFKYGNNAYYNGVQGGFGYGAHAETCAAGGGGGYYGGGSVYTTGGGGGSSFVTGYTGCDTTYRSNHLDKSGKSFNFSHVTMTEGTNDGDGKVLITYLGMNDVSSTVRQAIVEVYDHIGGNCAAVNELEFYDKSNVKLSYTTSQTEVYDTVNTGTPMYWQLSECWWNKNLNDGQTAYYDNSVGSNNCTAFLYSSSGNTGNWARFVIDFGQEVEVSKIKTFIGGNESRSPKSISVYGINNYSENTFNNNVKQRINDGLSLIGSKTFTVIDSAPTEYILDNP